MLIQQTDQELDAPGSLLKGASREEKRAFWKGVIGGWEESGETAAGYCRAREIPVAQFNYWKKRYADPAHGGSDEAQFVRFPGSMGSRSCSVRLEWRDFTLEINGEPDARVLSAVLRAIGAVA